MENKEHPSLAILRDCLKREQGKKSFHSQRMAADLAEAIRLLESEWDACQFCPVLENYDWSVKPIDFRGPDAPDENDED